MRQNLPQIEGLTLEKGIKGGYVALEKESALVTL